MGDQQIQLQRQIRQTQDLHEIVRAMKAISAANIGHYEQAVAALADYVRVVELGLGLCFHKLDEAAPMGRPNRFLKTDPAIWVVFGTDHGLVGSFNEQIADFVRRFFDDLTSDPGASCQARRPVIWAVGERVQNQLEEHGLRTAGLLSVPESVSSISALVGEVLALCDPGNALSSGRPLTLAYNRPSGMSGYQAARLRLLPLDQALRQELRERAWPGPCLPEVVGPGTETMGAFVREYLFVSIYRACAESLASENASRLAAMLRAEKNIEDRQQELSLVFNRVRQGDINQELFDVLAGYQQLED
jgi:F-type H+-transporting ATPase subunit gamma